MGHAPNWKPNPLPSNGTTDSIQAVETAAPWIFCSGAVSASHLFSLAPAICQGSVKEKRMSTKGMVLIRLAGASDLGSRLRLESRTAKGLD